MCDDTWQFSLKNVHVTVSKGSSKEIVHAEKLTVFATDRRLSEAAGRPSRKSRRRSKKRVEDHSLMDDAATDDAILV